MQNKITLNQITDGWQNTGVQNLTPLN